MRVLVTGASGMLGRAVVQLLTIDATADFEVLGLAWSRAEPPLRKVDLLDADATAAVFKEFRPDVVVHCAAERMPDRAAKDPERTQQLNSLASGRLAELCAECGASIIFISTDYVFDGSVATGEYPPYTPSATPHPLQLYGETKLAGEKAVLAQPMAYPIVLRVPVLYASDCETLSESASLVVAEVLRSTTPQKVDNWGARFPTLVDDVARCLKLIIDEVRRNPYRMAGVYHCSAPERTTKFLQALAMASILGVSAEHLAPDNAPPAGAPRPQNTQLDCSSLWAKLGMRLEFTPLHEGLEQALFPFVEEFRAAARAASTNGVLDELLGDDGFADIVSRMQLRPEDAGPSMATHPRPWRQESLRPLPQNQTPSVTEHQESLPEVMAQIALMEGAGGAGVQAGGGTLL